MSGVRNESLGETGGGPRGDELWVVGFFSSERCGIGLGDVNSKSFGTWQAKAIQSVVKGTA